MALSPDPLDRPCPECGSADVYRYREPIDIGGGYGPVLLPKLNPGPLRIAKALPVVCRTCGYIRLFASEDARSRLEGSDHWQKA